MIFKQCAKAYSFAQLLTTSIKSNRHTKFGVAHMKGMTQRLPLWWMLREQISQAFFSFTFTELKVEPVRNEKSIVTLCCLMARKGKAFPSSWEGAAALLPSSSQAKSRVTVESASSQHHQSSSSRSAKFKTSQISMRVPSRFFSSFSPSFLSCANSKSQPVLVLWRVHLSFIKSQNLYGMEARRGLVLIQFALQVEVKMYLIHVQKLKSNQGCSKVSVIRRTLL